ncbi:hypothetical protein HMPREF3156_01566 [Neisseria sp. HMSC06F02]|nr:hypothetical protein HMPREF3156_01566 [Neisseria sp. HMSC06F02]
MQRPHPVFIFPVKQKRRLKPKIRFQTTFALRLPLKIRFASA